MRNKEKLKWLHIVDSDREKHKMQDKNSIFPLSPNIVIRNQPEYQVWNPLKNKIDYKSQWILGLIIVHRFWWFISKLYLGFGLKLLKENPKERCWILRSHIKTTLQHFVYD